MACSEGRNLGEPSPLPTWHWGLVRSTDGDRILTFSNGGRLGRPHDRLILLRVWDSRTGVSSIGVGGVFRTPVSCRMSLAGVEQKRITEVGCIPACRVEPLPGLRQKMVGFIHPGYYATMFLKWWDIGA